MNWRKSIILSFLPLLAFLGVMLRNKETSHTPVKRQIASVKIEAGKKTQKSESITRKVSAFQQNGNQNEILRNRIPQSVKSSFTADKKIHLTRGYDFLTDVASVPKKDYRQAMGEELLEHSGFVFFRAEEGHGHYPVAISRTTSTLYPISSVLHIRGVTEDIRNTILAQGHEEYYYHAQLKLLSIKAESGQIMKTYSELREKGFNVELEVLRPKHKTI